MFEIINGTDYLKLEAIEEKNTDIRVLISTKTYDYIGSHEFYCSRFNMITFCRQLVYLKKYGEGFARLAAENHWELEMELYITLSLDFLLVTGSMIKFVQVNTVSYENNIEFGFEASANILTELTQQTWVEQYSRLWRHSKVNY